jgi:hypothetical protein
VNAVVVEVYDYVDANVRMLSRMYDRRLKGYSDMGYQVTDSHIGQLRLAASSCDRLKRRIIR